MTLADSLDPTTVAFIMGFGVLAIALTRQRPVRSIYVFFSGFIWLTSALTVFTEYGPEWVIVTVGLGLFLIIEGAMELAGVT